jgi:hypothetical protein
MSQNLNFDVAEYWDESIGKQPDILWIPKFNSSGYSATPRAE